MTRKLLDMLFSEDFDPKSFMKDNQPRESKKDFRRIDKKREKKRDFTQERKAKRNELELD